MGPPCALFARPEPDVRRGTDGRRGGPTAGPSRFVILRPHARGGLGEVFVAYDKELHREVALKEIRPDRADDPESRARFVLEAEITGSLEHPGIVPVYGLGQFGDGRPFYAMRFIQGDSLKEAIERFHAADGPGRDPGERALALRELLRPVHRRLQRDRLRAQPRRAAPRHQAGQHHAGQIRRDAGRRLGAGQGVGRAEGGAGVVAEGALRPASAGGSTPTVAGSALGHAGVHEPRAGRRRARPARPAVDIYGLGATLYCLLTGRAPLDDGDGDTDELLRRARAGEIPPPRQVKREVPPALEAICLKAMARRPEDRYDVGQGDWPTTSSTGWPTSRSPPGASRRRPGRVAGRRGTVRRWRRPRWRSRPG